jgi:hypothetical protein
LPTPKAAPDLQFLAYPKCRTSVAEKLHFLPWFFRFSDGFSYKVLLLARAGGAVNRHKIGFWVNLPIVDNSSLFEKL